MKCFFFWLLILYLPLASVSQSGLDKLKENLLVEEVFLTPSNEALQERLNIINTDHLDYMRLIEWPSAIRSTFIDFELLVRHK